MTKTVLVILLVQLVFHATPVDVFVFSDENAKISAANTGITQAFKAILEAEKAGANVSGLIARLDGAGGLLAEADTDFRNGNASQADVEADKAIIIANNVTGEAASLKNSAIVESQRIFWLTLGFSAGGSLASAVALILVWRWFRRRYVRKMFGMKPRVVSNAET